MLKIYYDAFIPCITNRDKLDKSYKYAFFDKKNNKRNNYQTLKKNRTLILNIKSNENDITTNELNKKIIDELNNENLIINDKNSFKNTLNVKILSALFVAFLFAIGVSSNPFRSKTVSFGISVLTLGFVVSLINKIKTDKKENNFEYIIETIKDSEKKLNIINNENVFSDNKFKDDVYLVYSKYLDHFSKQKNINFSEIEFLHKIKNKFNLSPQELGNCHFETAKNLYKKSLILSERKENNFSDLYINNFIFLSDVILSNDSKKGYQYEMNRIKKALVLNTENSINESKKKKREIYKNLIIELFTSNLNYNKDNISYYSSVLGLKNEEINTVHINVVKTKVNQIIDSQGKFSDAFKIELSKICSILNIDELSLKNILNEETFEICKNNYQKILNQITESNIDSIIDKIHEVNLNFMLTNESFINILKSLIVNKIIENLNELSNSVNLQPNLFSEKIETFLSYEFNVQILLEKLKSLYSSDKNLNLEIHSDNILNVFDLKTLELILTSYLKTSINDLKITDKIEINFLKLANFFNFSNQKTNSIFRIVVGPIYQNEILNLIKGGNFNDISLKKVDNLEKDLKLDLETIFINKKAAYLKFLESKVSVNSIFSNDDLIELENLINFLGINYEIIQNINDTSLEPIFKKATDEALGATYIIPSNYWVGLEKLRKRLRISEKKSKEIFYNCVTEKLKIVLEKAIIDNKKKNLPKENNEKDLGEDPTVNKDSGTSLGIEVEESENNQMFNLIDIYFRNNIFIFNESTTNNLVQESINGLSGRNIKRVQSINSSEIQYPINLRNYFEDKTVKEMYREYLISCFSVKLQTQKRRLFNNLDKLAPILGLKTNEISEIHTEVGSLIFNRYLTQSLSKGYLDDTDKAFLGSIQSTLSMDNGTCIELIKNSKKNIVSLSIEKIFMSPKIKAEGVKKLLQLIKSFEINIESDISVIPDQRQKLFRVAIEDAIENEQIKNNQNIITEIQNLFIVDEIIGKKILFDLVSTKSEGYLLNAIGSLRQGRIDSTINELKNMIKFGKIVTISLNQSVGSFSEKQKLIEIFKNNNSNDLEEIKILETMLNK